MAELIVTYWRDIPSMVSIGKGRRAAKAQLPERFEQAIDRCAMRIGARDQDAYLAQWRKGDPIPVQINDASGAQTVADEAAARLDAEYDDDVIKSLIANDGWKSARV